MPLIKRPFDAIIPVKHVFIAYISVDNLTLTKMQVFVNFVKHFAYKVADNFVL